MTTDVRKTARQRVDELTETEARLVLNVVIEIAEADRSVYGVHSYLRDLGLIEWPKAEAASQAERGGGEVGT